MSLSYRCNNCGSNNTDFVHREFRNGTHHLEQVCLDCTHKQYVKQDEAAKRLMVKMDPILTRKTTQRNYDKALQQSLF